MTQEEQDAILGGLVRERCTASRALATCHAKAERMARDMEAARTALLKELGWLREGAAPPSPFMPFEDMNHPDPDDVAELLAEMREHRATIAARTKSVDAIVHGE